MDDFGGKENTFVYSYFPRVEGKLPDGINAFSWNIRQRNFIKINRRIFRNVFLLTE